MNKENRHFGLFVYLGIELRNFVFSGLSSRLNDFAKVSIISHQTSVKLEEVIKEYNINLIRIPYTGVLDKKRKKIESYFLSSRRARIRLNGHEVFNLWHDTVKKRTKDYLIGNNLVYRLLQKAAKFENELYYYDNYIAEVIKSNQITDIILQSYFTPENMTMAITAKKLGCRVWVINWSWKDFYINEYIPFKPDCFFTWSGNLQNMYQKYNRHINSDKIIAIGNLSYDKMFNYAPIRPLEFYAKKYQFNPSSSIILYTMVHPRVFPYEQRIALKIAKEIQRLNLDFVILMKPNPMDTNWKRFHEVEINNKLITLENLWFYDDKSDFNMITEEGQTEWMDLIFYSAANISVASTVTIEYLIMKKPVINILFDDNEEPHNEFIRLYNAPFYRLSNEREDVIGCSKIQDVIDALKNLEKIEAPGNLIDQLIVTGGNSLNNFIKVVRENE